MEGVNVPGDLAEEFMHCIVEGGMEDVDKKIIKKGCEGAQSDTGAMVSRLTQAGKVKEPRMEVIPSRDNLFHPLQERQRWW